MPVGPFNRWRKSLARPVQRQRGKVCPQGYTKIGPVVDHQKSPSMRCHRIFSTCRKLQPSTGLSALLRLVTRSLQVSTVHNLMYIFLKFTHFNVVVFQRGNLKRLVDFYSFIRDNYIKTRVMRFIEMISYCRPEWNPHHSIVKHGNDIFWTISFWFSIAFVIIAMYLMYDNACPSL